MFHAEISLFPWFSRCFSPHDTIPGSPFRSRRIRGRKELNGLEDLHRVLLHDGQAQQVLGLAAGVLGCCENTIFIGRYHEVSWCIMRYHEVSWGIYSYKLEVSLSIVINWRYHGLTFSIFNGLVLLGKSTGNHGFYHQIWRFWGSCKFSSYPLVN